VRWLGLGVGAVTWLTFLGAIGHPFVAFDDFYYVSQNAVVQRGLCWESVRWAFTTFTMGNYHPLTWLSHELDWTLFAAGASGHHLTSVLIHAATTVLVFLFLNQVTRAPWRSALSAVLFGLHPLRVESVAWVSERKDVLSVFWGASTLLLYARYVRRPTVGRYLVALLSFALSLSAKAMLVPLPLLLLLLDAWPLARPINRRTLLEKLPFAGLSGLAAVTAVIAQDSQSALVPASLEPISFRVETAVLGYVRYLGLELWPLRLAAHYPLRIIHVPAGQLALGIVTLVLTTAATVWLWRRYRRPLFVGWLWFLVSLLPVIGLVQLGAQSLADRYTYWPSLGLVAGMVFSFPLPKARVTQLAACGLATAALTILGLLTHRQIETWKDSRTLFTHALEVEPGDPFSLTVLGGLEIDDGHWHEAEALLRQALAPSPWAGVSMARIKLAQVLLHEGRAQEAVEFLRRAYSLAPLDPTTRGALGTALAEAGHLDEALPLLREAASQPSEMARASVELAMALESQNKPEEALRVLEDARQRAPHVETMHLNLGIAYMRRQRFEDGIRELRRALELDPHDERAQSALQNAMEDQASRSVRQVSSPAR
jgi:tetratricopeptide (TPR) repeat protein